MLHVSEAGGVLEVVSPMPRGQRVLIALVALIPFIAPYELLYKVDWVEWRHPAFFFAAAVSAGALVVSALFVFAALGGLEQRLRVDSRSSLVTYSERAPLIGLRTTVLPFASIERLEVVTHAWSDGADSYSIRLTASDGRKFDTGSAESREMVESCAGRIRTVIGL
jgi:hypothetical protein